jgi:Na+/H+ antiporter NhaD/arsenite permease-like protein
VEQWFNAPHIDMSSVLAIMVLSATLSQLLSNVPLVALYLPMLANPDVQSLMVLAASNVIIIQNIEKRGLTTVLF